MNKAQNKNFISGILLLFIAIIQTSLVNAIEIYSVKPNLLLVFLIASAILRGSNEGAFFGVFIGFLQDAISGKILGFYMLIGLYTGLLVGIINKRLYKENIFVAIILTFITTCIYEVFVFIFSIYAINGGDYIYAIKTIILPEACYNSLVMLIFFFPMVRYYQWLEKKGVIIRKY